MKKIKFLLLLLLIVCFNSCTQHLNDDKGIVTRVEYSYQEGVYNVYLKSINKEFFCYGPLEMGSKSFFFTTENSSYHIGDTVKFVIQCRQQNIDIFRMCSFFTEEECSTTKM